MDIDGFVDNEGINDGVFVGDELGLINVDGFPDIDGRHDEENEELDEGIDDIEGLDDSDGSKDPFVELLSDPAIVDSNACGPDMQ